jgi:tubulin beta
MLNYEHNISSDGTYNGTSDVQREGVNVYYKQGTDGKHVPRAIMVDFQSDAINTVRMGELSNFFNHNYIVTDSGNPRKTWFMSNPKPSKLFQRAMSALWREAELCPSLQGFQLTHSMAGGTGSGMVSMLMAQLREKYPKKILSTFSVLPAKKDAITEKLPYTNFGPYNTVFSFGDLITNSDLTVCFDNEALCKICYNTRNILKPEPSDLNHIISLAMSGVTSCLRSPGQLNDSLCKLCDTMVPLSPLHFVVPSFAPLTLEHLTITVEGLTQQLLDANNIMVACDPKNGHNLAFTAMFQGPMSVLDADLQMYKMLNMDNRSRCNSISKSNVSKSPPRTLEAAATLMTNTTSIKAVVTRLLKEFNTNLQARRFLSQYENTNIKLIDFSRAESKLHNLETKYESYKCRLGRRVQY